MNNIESKEPYIVTRYFLDKDSQMHIDDLLNPKTKEELFLDFIAQLKEEKYLRGYIGLQQYRVYFSRNFSDSRLLLKFARKKDVIINNATETDIDKINQDSYPFSYIIVDTDRQLFLIQKNSEISTNTETIIHAIEKIFSSFLIEKKVTLRLTPITESSSFWETVKNNQGKISSLEFEFLSPNFLGQSYKINELMKELKEETNVDSMKMIMKNENGNLTVFDRYPFFKDALEYISNGGGKWKMHFSGGGKATSEEKPVEQEVLSSIAQNETDDKLQEIFSNIDLIEGENHEENNS